MVKYEGKQKTFLSKKYSFDCKNIIQMSPEKCIQVEHHLLETGNKVQHVESEKFRKMLIMDLDVVA